MQLWLRTRLSCELLHHMLCTHLFSRAVADADVGATPDDRLDDGSSDAAVVAVAVVDVARFVGFGSGGSLSDVTDVAEMLTVELGDDGVVQ